MMTKKEFLSLELSRGDQIRLLSLEEILEKEDCNLINNKLHGPDGTGRTKEELKCLGRVITIRTIVNGSFTAEETLGPIILYWWMVDYPLKGNLKHVSSIERMLKSKEKGNVR